MTTQEVIEKHARMSEKFSSSFDSVRAILENSDLHEPVVVLLATALFELQESFAVHTELVTEYVERLKGQS